ncbi:MAG: zf-TFIIB domain-containing protein [Candidatus Binatia bacterium]
MNPDEKDRFGNKLRDAERAREDQYFAKRDRELLEKLRYKEGGAKQGLGRCPQCGTQLQERSLHDVSVDECPVCHGIWLGEGELQELARRENEGWIARWLRQEFRQRD